MMTKLIIMTAHAIVLPFIGIGTCNTLRGRFKGNFCATNVMLHSKPL